MELAGNDWRSTFYEGAKQHGLNMSLESFNQYCGEFYRRPAPPPQKDGLTLTLEERQRQAFCLGLGLTLTKQELDKIYLTAADAWQSHIHLDPDATSVLQTLQQVKTIALVSNFDYPPHVRRVLSELRLTQFFKSIVISGEVGVKKPEPRIFVFALEQTGLQASEVIYVGDTEEDVKGALAAGIFPIRIMRPGTDFNMIGRTEKPMTISELSELVEMFE